MRSRRPVPPHRILRTDDVTLRNAQAWRVSVGDGAFAIPDRGVVPGWQPGLDVRVSNTLCLGPDVVGRLTASSTARVALAVHASATTAGGMATVASQTALFIPNAAGQPEAHLDLLLDGAALAGDVRVECSVILRRPTLSGDALSPRTTGSKIWTTDWRARLEGGRARLPIDVVCFSVFFRRNEMAGGLVHVDFATAPELDIEQGITVYLNADYPSFVAQFARREPYATAIVWDAVMRRVLIAGAESGFDDSAEYPRGSIGAHWQQWMSTAFPGLSAPALLDRHRSNTSEFEVRVQHWTRMAQAFPPEEEGA